MGHLKFVIVQITLSLSAGEQDPYHVLLRLQLKEIQFNLSFVHLSK